MAPLLREIQAESDQARGEKGDGDGDVDTYADIEARDGIVGSEDSQWAVESFVEEGCGGESTEQRCAYEEGACSDDAGFALLTVWIL